MIRHLSALPLFIAALHLPAQNAASAAASSAPAGSAPANETAAPSPPPAAAVDAEGLSRRAFEGDADALAKLTSACDQRDAPACYAAGELYRSINVKKLRQNPKLAVSCYEKGCDAGSGISCRRAAWMYTGQQVRREMKKAVPLYQKGCDAHDWESCDSLGFMYQTGDGVDKDPARALAIYKPACDRGNLAGCAGLARLYREGDGVPRDAAKALAMFRSGCDADDGASCFELSGYYFKGSDGVKKDAAMASELNRKACALGNRLSCFIVSANEKFTANHPKDCKQTLIDYETGCEHDISFSCHFAAEEYASGKCVPEDMARAGVLFQKACRLGLDRACSRYHVK